MSRRLAAIVLLPALTVVYAGSMSFPDIRLSPAEVEAMQAHEAGSGTSGVAGIETTVLSGDPTAAYTIALRVPAQCTPGSLS